jgi:regulator of nucleoside diphosphate kinase
MIAEDDVHCLQGLALNEASDEVASPLLRKLAGAKLVNRFRMPLDVVSLNCIVEFTLDGGNKTHRRLVHPRAAQTPGDLSVLSALGAGLIGLRAGQSTHCPDELGVVRRLQVLSVEYPGGALESGCVGGPS